MARLVDDVSTKESQKLPRHKTKEKISVDEGFVKAVGEEKMLPPPPGKIRITDLPSKIS
jgi:hypothetical protein